MQTHWPTNRASQLKLGLIESKNSAFNLKFCSMPEQVSLLSTPMTVSQNTVPVLAVIGSCPFKDQKEKMSVFY